MEINKELGQLVEKYSKDTWKCIERLAATKTGFPVDRLVIDTKFAETVSGISSPTNIGLFLSCIVGARDLSYIGEESLDQYLGQVMSSLERAKTYKGLFYNWYDTETGEPDSRYRNFISTVDNAWLVAGLIVIRSAVPAYKERASDIIRSINLSLLYDNKRELFRGGYDVDRAKPTGWHYDVLNTEARIASYIGINEFGIKWKHYGRLKRSPYIKTQDELRSDVKFFQSWGGSMFEALMPTIFMPEPEWSAVWKQNHVEYINEQIRYGVEHSDGFWGYSASEDPKGQYREFGVPSLAIKVSKDKVESIISPYSIFLTLPFLPNEAIENLKRLEITYPEIYKENLGFADSVNVETHEVSQSFLSLDQEMSFLSQYNYLSNNKLYDHFGSQLKASVGNILKVLDYEASLGLYD